MSDNLEAILKKSRDYYYHDGLISSEVDILVEEIDRLTKERDDYQLAHEIMAIEHRVWEKHSLCEIVKRAEKAEADQATRAEAVAALIRDCETAEAERENLLDTIEQAVRNPTLKAPQAVLKNALLHYRPEAINHEEG